MTGCVKCGSTEKALRSYGKNGERCLSCGSEWGGFKCNDFTRRPSTEREVTG